MKKAGYFLIVLILILQSGGMMLMFNMHQCLIQYQMIEKINSSNASFEKLCISVREYQKSRINDDEIRFNGKMYDVKSAAINGDFVELIVIYDIEEEEILVRIKNFAKSTSLPGNELPEQLHQLISLTYLPPYSKCILFNYAVGISIFHQSKLNFVSNISDILSPPPKQV